MKDIKYFKIVLDFFKKEKLCLIIFIISTLFMNIIPIVSSIMWANTVESLSLNNQSDFFKFLLLWLLLTILVWSIIRLIRGLIYNRLEKNFIKNGSIKLYDKILKLPAIAFEEIGVGQLTNRLNGDLEKVISLLSRIIDFISGLIMGIIILIYSFTISIYVGLEFVALAIVMYIFANIYFPKIQKIQEKIAEDSDEFYKNATEDFTGIREIKALGIRESASSRMNKIIAIKTDKQKSIARTEEIYNSANNASYFIIELIIFITMGLAVFSQSSTLALFLVINSIIGRFDYVVETFSDFGLNYNKVVISLKRIDEILNNRLYQDEKFGDYKLNDEKISIAFKNVKFKYKKDEDYILKGLSMNLEPNKKIAIVGKSGQGKTTIFNLLLRYFDTEIGSITLNNVDIKDLSEESLRKNISIIRQDPYLFNQSILANFKMIKKGVSLDEVRKVCKKAYIDDYIMSLPKKYNTIIGEGGINLSGGQKQRLAIARTLLKNTKVILFDEATSALDNESQEYIKRTIDELVNTHTIVIVAHRLSTIMDADIIYLIDKGKVLSKGTHKELMNNSTLYKKLYNPELKNNQDDIVDF